MIIDTSVILRAFFSDEAQAQAQALVRDHVIGKIKLEAPDLLLYEACNAVWQAERRGRIVREQADQVIDAIQGLQIILHPLEWGEMLPFARRFNRTAYDAAYLTLAHTRGKTLVTGDERLYNAVHIHLEWVLWIGDYHSPQPANPN
jgi:predicted nucleic acid-binding protein